MLLRNINSNYNFAGGRPATGYFGCAHICFDVAPKLRFLLRTQDNEVAMRHCRN